MLSTDINVTWWNLPSTASPPGTSSTSPSVDRLGTSLTAAGAAAGAGEESVRSVVGVALAVSTACLMWLLALAGNGLVCVVIFRSRRLQSTTNYFVVSLAGADLCYALLVVPVLIVDLLARRWLLGDAGCRLVRFVQLVVPLTMIAVLMAICVDRFYTIIYPLSFKVTRGGAKRLTLLSWVLGLLLASPGLYLYHQVEEEEPPGGGGGGGGRVYCRMFLHSQWESVYVVLLAVGAYFLPVLGMTVGYTRILRFIWRSGVGGRTFQRTTNPVPRSKVKMLKLIVLVNLVIVLLMAPWFISQLCFTNRAPARGHEQTVYIIVVWFFFANTVAKPIIYLCYNSNFRRGCKEVLCMSSMKCYRSNAYTITATSKFGKRNHIGIVESSLYGRETRRMESPTKTFDRTTMADKIAWPISSQSPSTYL